MRDWHAYKQRKTGEGEKEGDDRRKKIEKHSNL